MNARIHAMVLPTGALVISLVAAPACEAAHVPLPWTIGPMLAVAIVRICGAHVTAPRGGRQAGQWLIGTALVSISRRPWLRTSGRSHGCWCSAHCSPGTGSLFARLQRRRGASASVHDRGMSKNSGSGPVA